MDKAKAPAGAGAGANEQHTPLAEDSDIQGNEGEAADSQPGTHMQTRDESTAEGAGVVAETKHSLPPVGKVAPEVPRGRCVSGRVWKTRTQSQRASFQVTTATVTLSTSWKKKLEIKTKRQAAKAMEQEMRDTKRQEIEDKKQEKLERERRRQRNVMKNTTYQTISKTHKMKTMNKKQLRQIKKRQINPRTGEEEFVSPWGGGKK
ncbi:unnamed protein product [Ascophyllum nodosum]